MPVYTVYNAPMATTAATAKVSTGTVVKTMLQVATPATRYIELISWGYSLDIAPGAASVVELIQTDVAATVTAHVAAGVQPIDANAPASLLTLGVNATGYTATVEGTTTASRIFRAVQVPSTAGVTDLTYEWQWMPDERPIVAVSKFLRVRTTFAAGSSNMSCWVTFRE
ncbi:MAG: hypothetical protein JWN52_7092 [Actinomycetia bacterium]|nr:hypothetical protein [Actinomycetes bacterium]